MDKLQLTVSISPENLQRLNRGEQVIYDGILHPMLVVMLRTITSNEIPAKQLPLMQPLIPHEYVEHPVFAPTSGD